MTTTTTSTPIDYETTVFTLKSDHLGPNRATLVHARTPKLEQYFYKAILYLHGYVDYYFQWVSQRRFSTIPDHMRLLQRSFVSRVLEPWLWLLRLGSSEMWPIDHLTRSRCIQTLFLWYFRVRWRNYTLHWPYEQPGSSTTEEVHPFRSFNR